jgi:hypothetical protein
MPSLEIDHARAEILRAFGKLANIPAESWRDLAELVDTQLCAAWAGGYAARACAEPDASPVGAITASVSAVAGPVAVTVEAAA